MCETCDVHANANVQRKEMQYTFELTLMIRQTTQEI